MTRKSEIIVFGGGCFWCTEAIFQMLRGVLAVIPGYAGGSRENPSYDAVSRGNTGHAEVIRVEFDPTVISLRDLLDVFFHLHDPTTLNRQGADSGTQYRSAIFYTSEAQRVAAESLKVELASEFRDPIVTEIKPLEHFYEAEEYHRNYFRRNIDQPYCQVVISPKLRKLREKYAVKLK